MNTHNTPLSRSSLLALSLLLPLGLGLGGCDEATDIDELEAQEREDGNDDNFRSCGSDEFQVDGKCYFVATSYASNWDGANNVCAGRGTGWHLAYIETATESTNLGNALVTQFNAMGVPDDGYSRQTWLGARGGESSSGPHMFFPTINVTKHLYQWRDAAGYLAGTMESSEYWDGYGWTGTHLPYLWSIDFPNMFWAAGSNPFTDACVAAFLPAWSSDFQAQNFKCESGDKRALCELN